MKYLLRDDRDRSIDCLTRKFIVVVAVLRFSNYTSVVAILVVKVQGPSQISQRSGSSLLRSGPLK